MLLKPFSVLYIMIFRRYLDSLVSSIVFAMYFARLSFRRSITLALDSLRNVKGFGKIILEIYMSLSNLSKLERKFYEPFIIAYRGEVHGVSRSLILQRIITSIKELANDYRIRLSTTCISILIMISLSATLLSIVLVTGMMIIPIQTQVFTLLVILPIIALVVIELFEMIPKTHHEFLINLKVVMCIPLLLGTYLLINDYLISCLVFSTAVLLLTVKDYVSIVKDRLSFRARMMSTFARIEHGGKGFFMISEGNLPNLLDNLLKLFINIVRSTGSKELRGIAIELLETLHFTLSSVKTRLVMIGLALIICNIIFYLVLKILTTSIISASTELTVPVNQVFWIAGVLTLLNNFIAGRVVDNYVTAVYTLLPTSIVLMVINTLNITL